VDMPPLRTGKTSASMGSLDFVRLSPHCGQDDSRIFDAKSEAGGFG